MPYIGEVQIIIMIKCKDKKTNCPRNIDRKSTFSRSGRIFL